MDDLGNLIVGLVKVFVFIIKVAVNIAAELLTTLLAFFCFASLWKIPALLKCYDGCACDLDSQWDRRGRVIQCFLSLLLDIACLPPVLVSFMCVWRIGFFCKIWSGDDGEWRARAWMQCFLALLDCACLPALAICIMSLTRFYFLCNGCEQNGGSETDWSFKWRSEVWRQLFFLLLDLLCLPPLLLSLMSLSRFYFLCKGCEQQNSSPEDWSYSWRQQAWYQFGFLLLDLLCLPALLICTMSLTRFYFFCKGCEQTNSLKFDWSYNWRSEVWRQAAFLVLDMLCLPFLIVSLAAVWRCPFFFASLTKRTHAFDWEHDWRSQCMVQSALAVLDILCFPFFAFSHLFFWRIPFLHGAKTTYSNSDDWHWNWRADCFPQFFFAFLDILCAFPLAFSVLSWRNAFFFGGFRARKSKVDASRITRDWLVDWRSECLLQLMYLLVDMLCMPVFVFLLVGPWRIPFFLAGARSRPSDVHNDTKSSDHDWAFAYRSELFRQTLYFALDLFFIFPVVLCILSIWRIPFVRAMYAQELKEMASSTNKSDFPGQIRLRCLQQVIYLFLDILTFPCIPFLLVSFWRWGYIWRGLQNAGSDAARSWPYDWSGNKRSCVLYQARCTAFDVFCTPLVVLLALCPWRFYAFWSGMHNPDVVDTVCAGIFPADVITDHPSCWRFKALKNTVLMARDILSLPLLCISIVSWRNPFFFRVHRVQTIWTLQKIEADSRIDRTVPMQPSSPSTPLMHDQLVPVAALIANDVAGEVPKLILSPSPVQQPALNTTLFVSEIPQQDGSSAAHAQQHDADAPAAPQVEPPASADQVVFNTIPAPAPSAASSPVPRSVALHGSDTLPWFDPKTMDWYVNWRLLSFIQTVMLLMDLLTLPFLAFYLASIYRVCVFPIPVSQLIPSDHNLDDRIASLTRQGKDKNYITDSLAQDWDIPFRCLLMNHTACILFDIMCFPFFIIAKLSWRGHSLTSRSHRIQTKSAAQDPDPSVAAPSSPVPNDHSAPPAPSVDSQAQLGPQPDQPKNNPNGKDEHTPSIIICIRDMFLHEVQRAVIVIRLSLTFL